MGDTVSDISVGDLDILKDVGADMNSWIGNLRTALKCKSHQEVTIEKLTKPGITKDILAKILIEGHQTVYSHRDQFESSRVCFEKLKSELIAAQRSVVEVVAAVTGHSGEVT